jgi:leucine dehydrogenase
MQVFSSFGEEYEQIVFAHDPASGLRTIIAIYSTTLGPALGGTRFWPFATEEDAFRDALRLAKAMAYKASAAGLDLGGGKGVIIGDPRRDKTPELLRAYGRAVDRCGGAYVTTADVGTTSADLAIIGEATTHVTGTPGASGDPSPVTGLGVFSGIRAVAEDLWGSPSLEGRHVVVQGVGKVGASLVRLLAEAGARLTISDLDAEAAVALARATGAALVSPTDALAVPCDILAPCALGPVVTDETLKSFDCRAIVGAANNQLERPDHAQALADAGILYAPDYIVNAGGLISVGGEVMGYDHDEAMRRAEAIGDTLKRVLERARADGIPTAAAADAIAEERITSAR